MTRELVNAWSAWEKFSAKRRKAFSPQTGKAESARLVSAEIAAALEAGMTHMTLHDLIAEGRRDGLTVEQAVVRALG